MTSTDQPPSIPKGPAGAKAKDGATRAQRQQSRTPVSSHVMVSPGLTCAIPLRRTRARTPTSSPPGEGRKALMNWCDEVLWVGRVHRLRGGWLDGDLEPELFELVDELALTAAGVVEAGGVVGTHLLVGDLVGQEVPDDDEEVVGDGHGGLFGAPPFGDAPEP